MGRPPKDKSVEKEEVSGTSPEQQALSYLKNNKEDHYNFEDNNFYYVPSSSFRLTRMMSGGLTPGAHRNTGPSESGKTSCALDFMFNFLKEPGRRGVYIKSEGRLSSQMIARSGITFITDPSEWKDGTCFVFESNVYEAVFGLMGELIRNNETKKKYFFIIDSMDMLAKKDDLAKPLNESGQVAGGALITSVFLKKTSAALAKRGHIVIFVSQVRDVIKINQYEKTQPRQGSASGGHAIEHAPDWVFEFLPRRQEDLILEGAKGSKAIGHTCRIKIAKSPNETTGQIVDYPVKYGRVGGKSVWAEREIVDMLLDYQLVEAAGAWLKPSKSLIEEVAKDSVEMPEKIQGIANLYKFFEDNPKVVESQFNKFQSLLSV